MHSGDVDKINSMRVFFSRLLFVIYLKLKFVCNLAYLKVFFSCFFFGIFSWCCCCVWILLFLVVCCSCAVLLSCLFIYLFFRCVVVVPNKFVGNSLIVSFAFVILLVAIIFSFSFNASCCSMVAFSPCRVYVCTVYGLYFDFTLLITFCTLDNFYQFLFQQKKASSSSFFFLTLCCSSLFFYFRVAIINSTKQIDIHHVYYHEYTNTHSHLCTHETEIKETTI